MAFVPNHSIIPLFDSFPGFCCLTVQPILFTFEPKSYLYIYEEDDFPEK
jgi:hypothetical protein